MYFEMKDFDKAKELAEEIIQNSDDDYIVSKAKQLLENFNGS
jgi:FimV-like protein